MKTKTLADLTLPVFATVFALATGAGVVSTALRPKPTSPPRNSTTSGMHNRGYSTYGGTPLPRFTAASTAKPKPDDSGGTGRSWKSYLPPAVVAAIEKQEAGSADSVISPDENGKLGGQPQPLGDDGQTQNRTEQ